MTRRIMVIGLHPMGLAVAVCSVSTEPREPTPRDDMPPLPPGVTEEDVIANVTADTTNGWTDLEWRMALDIFEEQLAHTPEERRDQPIGEKGLSPNQYVQAVRDKTELGSLALNALLRRLMLAELGL